MSTSTSTGTIIYATSVASTSMSTSASTGKIIYASIGGGDEHEHVHEHQHDHLQA